LVNLARGFVSALDGMREHPSWLASRGTVGGLVRTLKRIRWQCCTATCFIDDEGAIYDTRADAPETIRAAAQRSSHRRLVRRLGLVDAAQQRITTVQTAPVKSVMKSKLPPEAKAIARKLFTGGIWTGERSWAAGVTPVRRPCPHCGSVDTLQHRLWWCISCEDRRLLACKPELLVAARNAPVDDVLFTRGIAALDTKGAAPPRNDDQAWWWPHPP